MNQLDVWIDDELLGGSALVGHLQRTTSRTGEAISFEYDPQWLANAGPLPAFPLDHEDSSPDSGLLLATADYYRIPKKDVGAIAGEVRNAVRGWDVRARALGASGNDIARMRGVIDPEH